ncbi:MAG: response regulator [Spirochaetales bacterium]|nr:response regulator [Spirochaetales bacterium]
MSNTDFLTGKKIIIADDEDFIRTHLCKRLSETGLVALEAASGRQVIDLMEEQPDLILMDVRMPEIDGYETTRMIRSGQKSADIPIILLSALADQEDIDKGLAAGADEFICKPVTFAVILEAVTRKLDSLQIS